MANPDLQPLDTPLTAEEKREVAELCTTFQEIAAAEGMPLEVWLVLALQRERAKERRELLDRIARRAARRRTH